jgi:hypothetical protein
LHCLPQFACDEIDRIGIPQVEAGPRWSYEMLRDATPARMLHRVVAVAFL